MHPSKMLSLPPSLLVLLAAVTLAPAQHPTAIRKMSLDEGEKFMPEYYAFGPEPPSSQQQPLHQARAAPLLVSDEELLLSGNSSTAIPFLPPYPRHYDYRSAAIRTPVGRRRKEAQSDSQSLEERARSRSSLLYRRAREALARLQGRQFACPDGTHSCTNIDQPDYCCATGTTCFVVTDAPDAGNVGCCPAGANCGVSVGACADGATACPADLGGGCCIPGFVCADVGCVSNTVSVITPTPTRTTVTSTVVSSPSPPTTQVVTVIVTVTPPGGGAPVTSTTTQTTTAGGSSSSSDTTSASSSPTTSADGVPPYRPTSGSSSITTDPSSSSDYCPTGFYACVASAGGGCCRTGRDCSTTSCPAAPRTTIESNGATVVVPVTDADADAAASPTSTCAPGWNLCGADAGPVAGCCPTGYACGTASCTLSASTATATVQKQFPSSAGRGVGDARPGVEVLLGALLILGVVLHAAGVA
ncbi:hypothetical protein GGR52DRAFT_585616 [Hypoxylon sp. FL1284]|nr:hypothetical protein GGR52DRAFT_585616 [Hypoxylon sp. FL1284]